MASLFNSTIDAVALAFILKQPWVDIVLSGAATKDQLRSNLTALDIDDLPEISMTEEPEMYWKRRTSLSWN